MRIQNQMCWRNSKNHLNQLILCIIIAVTAVQKKMFAMCLPNLDLVTLMNQWGPYLSSSYQTYALPNPPILLYQYQPQHHFYSWHWAKYMTLLMSTFIIIQIYGLDQSFPDDRWDDAMGDVESILSKGITHVDITNCWNDYDQDKPTEQLYLYPQSYPSLKSLCQKIPKITKLCSLK